ncbi:hypothetical protein U1Q18_024622, partial [Sarracenia purpurea var. burkii]
MNRRFATVDGGGSRRWMVEVRDEVRPAVAATALSGEGGEGESAAKGESHLVDVGIQKSRSVQGTIKRQWQIQKSRASNEAEEDEEDEEAEARGRWRRRRKVVE